MLLLGNYTVLPILVTNYDKTLCKSYLNLLVSSAAKFGLVWNLMSYQLRVLSSEKFRDIPEDELWVDVSLKELYVGWSANHGLEIPSMGQISRN